MHPLYDQLISGNQRALARCITMVENESEGYTELLTSLKANLHVPVVGITGPPGAGKSSLVSALTSHCVKQGMKVAVIAVDPSSPFTQGAIMGDRVRMNEHFLAPGVFIRSMATRGSLGGLAPKVYEVAELIKNAGYDMVFIETVGVGQSEVEIAALADTTVLVLVPEAGDEIQTIKSGVMEIADVYVLNKSDRENADSLFINLRTLAHTYVRNNWEAPVVKTVAVKNEGVGELFEAIRKHRLHGTDNIRKLQLMTDKALMLIRENRTRNINVAELKADLSIHMETENFNLFSYVKKYT